MDIKIKKFEDTDENVWKYIFEFKDAIAEAVLYRYDSFEERTVMCVSVQSGCPVGCKFCGTGKKFIRDLTHEEILYQVNYLIKEVIIKEEFLEEIFPNICKKFQIMFMSMGEPMLNWENVKSSIVHLNALYPNAYLLVSTVGIKNEDVLSSIINISKYINKVGLQFSIHEAFDLQRNFLIPFKNKLNLREIRDYGILWNFETSRQVYLNYCVHLDNISDLHLNRLIDLFPPKIFAFTFSVICESKVGKCSSDNIHLLLKCQERFLESGYNVRIFDPAGKDTIGGGCGQLWYTQEYFKTHE